MNVLAELFGAGAASAALAWLTTYAVHSTILLGGAALLTARLVRDEGWREVVWKIALVGGVVTASAQAMRDVDPLAGRLSFAAAPALEAGDVVTPAAGAGGDFEGAPAEGDATRTVRFDGPAGQGEGEAAADLTAPVGRVDAPRARPVSEASSGPGVPTLNWPAALLLVWALLATFLLGRLALRQSRLWRLLRGRRDVRDGGVRSLLAELRRNAGYWRPVRLTATSACATPLALGSSEICVPERLVSRLGREAQRSALAHELAHLRRRDPHWQLATGVLESVLFFQPLNRLARRRIRESAEHLCDDWAVRQTGSAVGLARCLAEVAGWIAPTEAPIPAGTAAMAEDGSPLLRRVERVLRGDVGSHEPRPLPRALAAGAALAVVVAAAPAIGGAAAPVLEGAAVTPARSASGPARDVIPSGIVASQQEDVIRHPRPAEPLDARWRWGLDEAGRRAGSGAWVAFGFRRLLAPGHVIVDDSRGFDFRDLDRGRTLGERVLGPDWTPRDSDTAGRYPILVLFHVREGVTDRITMRSADIGLETGGDPIFWLGEAEADEVVAFLTDRLESRDTPTTDPRLREVVVEAIAVQPSEDSVDVLRGILAGAETDDVREAAVEGLAWHPGDDVVAILRRVALEDGSADIRAEAAETLGEISSPAASAALREVILRGEPEEVRGEAVEAAAERQDPALADVLVEVALNDPSDDVRVEAIETLSEFPRDLALPRIRRLARTHPEAEMRKQAVEHAANLPPRDVLPLLREVFERETDSGVLRQAVETLGELPREMAVPELERLLRGHPSEDVRDEALDLVGDLVIGDLDIDRDLYIDADFDRDLDIDTVRDPR